MAFNHRKFLLESDDNENAALEKCKNACDDDMDGNGTCPRECLDYCSVYCYSGQDRPPPPPPSDGFDSDRGTLVESSKLSLFLSIGLGLLIISFLIFACYVVCKFCLKLYRSRRRLRQELPPEGDELSPDGDYGPVVDHPIWYIRTVGLQPSDISAITIVKFKKGDGLLEGTNCSVCLSEFEEDEALRLLPKCNHAFHIPCIDTWLRSHTNCPMCRAGIVSNRSVPSLPSEEPNAQDSRSGEEIIGAQAPECDGEVGRESENEGSEMRIRFDNELDGMQTMRRSVSMNSPSASAIRNAVATVFPAKSGISPGHGFVDLNMSNSGNIARRDANNNQRLSTAVGRASTATSLQAGSSSSSITRSLSCGAKMFISMYNSKHRS